jgi:hypothetical protein
VVVAERSDLFKFEKTLKSEFEVRRTGHLGFADGMDDLQEVDVLKGTIRLNKTLDVVELEADRRHVEVLKELYGMQKARAVATPRVKIGEAELAKIEKSEPLCREEALKFRSGTMRAAYLAVDRPDIAEAVKFLSSAMATPRQEHVVLLKRLIRHLIEVPRLVIKYEAQAADSPVKVQVDSDWGGELKTRRSTTRMAVMRGRHLLRHSSTLQQRIGLSSTDCEYYAMVQGACYGLGTQSYLMDWNIDVALQVYSGSSSARSFSKRQGLGQMRHVMTSFLWLQERVRLAHLEVVCIKGDENPADLFTKNLTRNDIMRHCEALGCSAVAMNAAGTDDDDYDDLAPLYDKDEMQHDGPWRLVTRRGLRRLAGRSASRDDG